MRTGFIGLGNMGSGMAANLVKAGHEVTVYNRSPNRMAPLAALGATAAKQVADTCKGEAVMTMLADDNAVESVVFGEGGIIANLSPGAVHISCSTISVALSRRLTRAHADAGQCFVSAPVFGRPDVAVAGKLFVMAGGAADAIERSRPLLDAVSQRTFVMSDQPDAANLVKLSGNFLIVSVIESLGEAMALVGKGGVDLHAYLELLTSTLFGAPVYRTYGGLVADRKFEPPGLAAPLAYKDIRLALTAAEDLRVPLPFASLLRDRFIRLLAHGGDKLDCSAIGQLAADDANHVPDATSRQAC
jgi:3-hydroxyisobutyrate dehydrogenase-like beta-hydroxyacid dehydrogenase